MSKAWFVTGTDTGVGKTAISCALLRAAAQSGLRTAAIKPVAAGCEADGTNEDGLRLQAAITEAAASVDHGELPVVRGDEAQLSQDCLNLIANSLKFAAPDRPPRVAILVSRDQDAWIFEVRDNGIGIAKESVDEIFLLFKRLHSDQDYPGPGLGLAISRRIVERHGGTIWATSSPGEGSSFFFTLPVAADS